VHEYRGREYDDAEWWAMGFVDGMKLCQSDRKPLLDTPQGHTHHFFVAINSAAQPGTADRMCNDPFIKCWYKSITKYGTQ
jgi:hypothetical protein